MQSPTVRTVHLGGFLGRKYGKTHVIAGENMFQIMSGLRSIHGPEFVRDGEAHEWHVFDGPKKKADNTLDETQLNGSLKSKHIYIVPAVKGASAVLRTVLGVILFTVGFFIPGAQWLMAVGASLALGGIAEMLTPKPSLNKQNNQTSSFVYDAAVNITAQGGPVPLLYGHIPRASAAVISTDFSNDQLLASPISSTITPVYPNIRSV